MSRPKTVRAPGHLRPATKRWWRKVITTYDLEDHHVRLLTLAGEAWDRCEQARNILAEEGLTFLDRFNQPKGRPEIAIERDSRLAFARMIRELCLDDSTPEQPRIPRHGGQMT